ncbi:MAG: metallophosphoesterase [bacterium]|nr:metallophosphoesterase [bacterium]
MSGGKVPVFLTVVLGVWTLMHLYVFLRLAATPLVMAWLSRRGLLMLALALWASYPLARIMHAQKWELLAQPLECIGATWIGVILLLLVTMLVVDVFTAGGLLLPRLAPMLRGVAVIAGGVLAVIALVQGLRPPVVREYEVTLAGLPRARDGMVLVVASDMHLGTLIGKAWLTRLVARINGLRPDLIILDGDTIDGSIDHAEALAPVLGGLRAPLGVWAVTGNHEYYAGIERCVRLLEEAGCGVLRGRRVEIVPGLSLAGVDDLAAHRRRGMDTPAIASVLTNHPPGAVILLSHAPVQADAAAAAGAGLMLSGHTHGGQIWPFGYLVRLNFPLLGGRYAVAGMPVIVCRGTGTWGPRMRLWRPCEMVRVTLRAAGQSRAER